ncbi:hypothetical protein CI109_100429 [Kwoniella shandongensis]|uniref:Uncharacterized protein n=1 Tax=Kwoniella shandongensis TaxID=1734106 RepID=A0A5M6C3R2_9TREE|nr:uncharacterized protein CI109_001727 [Kwoniella shandongensis]KAA5529787.1 hypothetical protein CI109_001727 [Kwoniella shandongensis]
MATAEPSSSKAVGGNSSPPPASVFSLIHELHTTITQSIDTALDWDQLNSPPINYTLVRPIVQRFTPKPATDEKASNGEGSASLGIPTGADGGELGTSRGQGNSGGQTGPSLGGVLYALMANRIQFITLSAADLSYQPLQTARAAFCELLAIKILRTFPHPEDEAELVGELVRGYCPFDGAPAEVWASMGDDKKDVEEMTGSALELAIVSTSKHFLSLPLIQHLVNQIYSGHLIYSPISSRALLADSYVSERTKSRRRNSHSHGASGFASLQAHENGKAVAEDHGEVYVYNPYEAGWLDHQRLKVPKWRRSLEGLSFATLLVLFVWTLAARDLHQVNAIEIIYVIFSFGFILDEFAASKEHGWTVYSANAWNAFDMCYIAIFLLYFALRIFGLASHSPNTSDLAFDILACAACIIFPRLVFFVVKENVVILALRGMVTSFISFMIVTVLAFSGICFCLWTLGRATWTVKQIVWLMAQIWFGSSYLGFAASESFHPIFGPIVLISYAALCNVLLITMLIAILSNKFAAINQNAHEEHLFQRVVKTVEGVKSDALFSYLPPINILAFAILVPLSWVCSARTFHRINVFAIRLTSFPILIGISAYERWHYRHHQKSIHLKSSTMDRVSDVQRPGLLDSWLGGGSEVLIASVFEAGPPPPITSANTSGIVTPPKASSVTALAEDADNPEDALAQAVLQSQSPDALRQRQPRNRDRTFDSPLAKLFGLSSSAGEKDRKAGKTMLTANGGSDVEKDSLAAGEVVDSLKKELEEVRKSQLRMEELLAKVLAGSGSP